MRAVEVDGEALKAHRVPVLVLLLGAHPVHNGVYPHHQLFGGEGFDHVVVHPQLEAVDAVVLLPPGGEHEHRGLAHLADLRHGGEAVQLRHHHVHDDQVESFGVFPTELHGLHAVLRLGDRVALEFRVLADEHADFGLVVYHQQMVHTVCPPWGAGLPRCFSAFSVPSLCEGQVKGRGFLFLFMASIAETKKKRKTVGFPC